MILVEKIKQLLGHKKLMGLAKLSVLYYLVFFLLELREGKLNIIEVALDRRIPFCEYFILPYLLWFPYVAGCVIWLCLARDKEEEYLKLIRSLIVGMGVFVLFSLLYPNGQVLRPALAGENIFERLVIGLYRVDTPTNIFPSLHVFNSIVCCIAVCRNCEGERFRLLRAGTILLTLSIILATMFLKQHSTLDVLGAILLNMLCYRHYYEQEFLFRPGTDIQGVQRFRKVYRIREKG